MSKNNDVFTQRLANINDLESLKSLMNLSIRKFIGDYLDAAQVEASFEIMGVDSQLIRDETYFVLEDKGQIVGCGGWSRRATLFGGDKAAVRDARLLDPKTEPARIRAMYTHPDFGRRGIGRRILNLCESAAKEEGFTRLELVSTVAGEPLYQNYGFSDIERIKVPTSTGLFIPCARMAKDLS